MVKCQHPPQENNVNNLLWISTVLQFYSPIAEVQFALYGTDGKPSNGSAGVVLVKVLNRTVTVSPSNFSDYKANVMCKELGYNYAEDWFELDNSYFWDAIEAWTITTPGSNRQPLTPDTHNSYIFLSILCQNLYSVSHFLCPILSQNSITAEVCKKQRSERSEAAVSPPGRPAVSVPPLARVDIVKFTTPYTNTPCATSGRVSCELSTRHVQCREIHVLGYTFNSAATSVANQDTDESSGNDTGKQSSSDSTSSNTSQRLRVTSRKPIGNRANYSKLIGDDNEEDDDDGDGPKKSKQKILNGDHLLTPLKRDCHLPVVSPLTEETPTTVSESLKNKVIEFIEKDDDEQDSGNRTPPSPLYQNQIARLDITKSWPTPSIHITPAKRPKSENDEEIDGYFTGIGAPEITPLPIHSGKKRMLLSPYDSRFSRIRPRSRSVGPYPPAEIVKKRLRLKVDKELFNATPVRKRSPSESDINFAESFSIPKHELGCIRINEEGYHDCSAGRESLIHIKHDFLNGDSNLTPASLVTILENTLNRKSYPMGGTTSEDLKLKADHKLGHQSIAVIWNQEVVDSITNRISAQEQRSDLCHKEAVTDPLLYLLAKLNAHYQQIDIKKTSPMFNSLEIISMEGRNFKIDLSETDRGLGDPMICLHMGRERALNIIPKKLNIAMMDVFDVQLTNLAVISALPKTTESMLISLARENALEADILDFHIIVSPKHHTLREEDNVPTQLQRREFNTDCKVIETGTQLTKDVTAMEQAENPAASDELNVSVMVADTQVTKDEGSDQSETREELPNHHQSPATNDEQNELLTETQLTKTENSGSAEQRDNASKKEAFVEPQKALTTNVFLQEKTCELIIEGQKSAAIKKWLKFCNLKSQGNNLKNQASLLQLVKLVNQQQAQASKSFISGMVEKMKGSLIDGELFHLGLDSKKTASLTDAAKKKLLRERILDTQEGRAQSNDEKTSKLLPTMLSDSSDGISSQEDSADEWETPAENSNSDVKLKEFVKKKKAPITSKNKRAKKKKETSKVGTSTGSNQTDTLVNCDSCKSITEGPLKVLQECLLRLQDDICKQNAIIENLAIRTRTMQEQHANPKTPPPNKRLEANNKLIFETLNTQQTCLDTITDSLSKMKKDYTKTKNKIDALEPNVQKTKKSVTTDLMNPTTKVNNNATSSPQVAKRECIPEYAETSQRQQTMILCVLAALWRDNQELKSSLKEMRGMSTKDKSFDQAKSKAGIEKEKSSNNNGAQKTRSTNELNNMKHHNTELSSFSSTAKEPQKDACAMTENSGIFRIAEKDLPQTTNTSEKIILNSTKTKENKKNDAPPDDSTDWNMSTSSDSRKHLLPNPKTNQLRKTNILTNCKANLPFTGPKSSQSKKFNTHKCLIVHDAYFDKFEQDKFSRVFDISRLKEKSAESTIKNGNLISRIKAVKPETVVIHVGFGDVLCNTEGNIITNNFKKIIYNVLENTSTKLCVSLMIPVPGYPETNSRLRQINNTLREFISCERTSHKYKDRLFTTNNDSLGGYIERKIDDNGKASIQLSERGQSRLWLRLRDSLQRSVGIQTPSKQTNNRTLRNDSLHE
ncbi:uncharacterized protein LOC134824771 [Bolinopsis microptera]|uniref:uncharacterized protein LOC134824771 n=1 Tax=Bolinopsis microptera TaxID=2820187 RepID=UPI003078E2DE